LAAREANGEWVVRIEDIDRPRELPGSAQDIIRTLTAFGFEWTGSIVRQSDRTSLYEAKLKELADAGLAYRCSCSRKAIAAHTNFTALQSGEEPRYAGLCRQGPLDPGVDCAIRLKVEAEEVSFIDGIQGTFASDVNQDCGDFVLKRRDGLFAYQLAVVVDDAEQGITHVVRGADLLNVTPRQILLQRALSLPPPAYAHVPLATDCRGVKLSKSAGAGAVDARKPAEELWRSLEFLRQSPPAELRFAGLDTVWNWAFEHWTAAPLKGLRQTVGVASSTGRSG
jgi:glutamyl-Q tRNA(Asp) synthetase